uniref:NADH-ubiquinone oxidoreductase chain 2 n=1 Tax=Elateroidea sp. 3 KM-2017 TaxID=2219426 RepID=A0A346RFU5_9COLE|nr:NADH dehydrogenase subunit 2 [Elateroidea sp. 3 KM-2017]
MLFFTTLISGTLITISAYSWLGMWMGLEINLLSILPLMHKKNNLLTVEATTKYFITQALASSIILMSILMMMVELHLSDIMNKSIFMMMMNSALMTKMGAAPFHFWFPEVMEGLSWMNCLLLSTWQKVAPMVLIIYTMNSMLFMSIIIITSMVVSALMGINQTSLRKMLSYSSINHLGWMMSALMFMETTWLYYFLIYSIINATMMATFKELNASTISQLTQKMNSFSMNKKLFMMNFLNLSGVPPFLGFYPKWMVIQLMMSNKFILMPTMMIILTLITIFMYFRIISTSLINKPQELSWKKSEKKNQKKKIAMINFTSLASLTLCTIMFSWA